MELEGRLMSKHDIDSINAAIALGDPVVPPLGVMIRFNYGRGRVYRITEHFIPLSAGEVYVQYVDLNGSRSCIPWMVRLYPINSVRFNIVTVPEEAPPFEEWYRISEVDR
jgi:hypothetical protein